MFKFRLFPLSEMDGAIGAESGVESVPAAEGQAEVETASNFEKAFAKRLAEAKSKWESEVTDKYKDYDTYKKSAEYFAKINNVPDVMTLKERIEMEELQEAAEKQQVPVEVLKRLQELEAKASKGEELERTMQQQQEQQNYWSNIEKFAESKGADMKALNQFMIDNEMSYDPNNMERSFELAYKAMRHDELSKQVEEAEKQGMKKLLQAKSSIPNVTGNKAQGQVTSPAPKTFAEARARAMQRFTRE